MPSTFKALHKYVFLSRCFVVMSLHYVMSEEKLSVIKVCQMNHPSVRPSISWPSTNQDQYWINLITNHKLLYSRPDNVWNNSFIEKPSTFYNTVENSQPLNPLLNTYDHKNLVGKGENVITIVLLYHLYCGEFTQMMILV